MLTESLSAQRDRAGAPLRRDAPLRPALCHSVWSANCRGGGPASPADPRQIKIWSGAHSQSRAGSVGGPLSRSLSLQTYLPVWRLRSRLDDGLVPYDDLCAIPEVFHSSLDDSNSFASPRGDVLHDGRNEHSHRLVG